MRVKFKLFENDSLFHKILNLLFLPIMAIASAIAFTVYISLMFLTILVIQFAGLLLGIYSFLKWIYDATFRLITGEPLPARR